MDKLIKEQTDDGSFTLYVPNIDEHYHSTKGAVTEAQHIFINQGLLHRGKTHLKVLEVGFGTGLNALETIKAAKKHQLHIEYHTLELHPLGWDDVKELNYSQSEYYREIIDSKWDVPVDITSYFNISKYIFDFTQLNNFNSTKDFDVIYFDAFAPEKQPEMWNQQLFDRLYVLLADGGLLTTYCAKGVVRRMLQTSKFQVERIPGPPNGKREILRANKIKL